MATAEKPLIDSLDDLAKEDAGVVIKNINRRAIIMDFTIRQWEGRRRIEGAEIVVKNDSMPAEMTTSPTWSLKPKEWREKFNSLVNKLRTKIRAHSVQPKKGLDVIVLKDAPDLLKWIRQFRETEFNPEVDRFVAAWPTIIESFKQDLLTHFKNDEVRAASVFKMIEKHLPDQTKLRSCFGIDIEVMPFGSSLDSIKDAVQGEAAEELVSELAGYAKKFADQVLTQIMAEPLAELEEVVNSVLERVSEGKGGLRSESIDMICRTLDKVKAFDSFIGSPKLLESITKAEELIKSNKHSDLNESIRQKSALSAGLAATFRALNESCKEQQATLAKYGKNLRRID